MNTLVSVLIAAFHAETFIARSVTSVLRQTYPHWEIIIASDDGQDYQEILNAQGMKDSHIRFTSTQRIGAGSSAARNAALDKASGDILAVLDSDDAFADGTLEVLVPKALTHGAATSNIRIIRQDTREIFPSLGQTFDAGILSPEQFIRANIHTYSLLVWDRKRHTGRWDEKLTYLEDLVYGFSMYNVLDGIYYDPSCLHDYYKRQASITSNLDIRDGQHEKIPYDKTLQYLAATGASRLSKTETLDALTRYHNALIKLQQQYFLAPPTDPVMGFYQFMKTNRSAFFDW